MFDTMTMTKVLGALCGSLLVFLLGGWAADLIYHGGGGHGDDHQQAYVIEVEGGDEEPEEEVEEVDFAAVMAEADAGAGEKVFSKCKACHKLEDGGKGTGPHLWSIVGRDIAAVGDFGYSNVLAEKEGDWTPEHLQEFLADPKGWAPGTKMSFAGLKKIEDRANLIAYLETIGG
ncbi:c-type cytochrome [Litoreibacter arenae]|uniref:Membrane c-type cytochrome cy n=1 Tax=Litoreibacter arenae DSM 19593 TaxID=1123360 RepID=S9QE77_9RHOB|nr:cytochrome c family protein [Litoreibacter arenae]EPX77893.1 membrane c-type cytochrome cy [Litoreibacter arenae DSM 19593]